jgi:hypothetical protein
MFWVLEHRIGMKIFGLKREKREIILEKIVPFRVS